MALQYLDKAIKYFSEIYSSFVIKLTVFVIIILIGFVLGKIIGKFIYKLLHEMGINNYFRKATGINASPDDIISKSFMYVVDLIAIIIALDAIEFSPTIIYGISVSLIIILIFSVIIGIKDMVPNIIAGLYLFRRRRYKVGDKIEIHGHKGTVSQITLTETTIKKSGGSLIYVPNSEFVKKTVVKK